MLAPKPQKYKHHVMSTFGWQETNKGNIPYKVQFFIFTSRDIFVQNWKRWHSRFLSANDAIFSYRESYVIVLQTVVINWVQLLRSRCLNILRYPNLLQIVFFSQVLYCFPLGLCLCSWIHSILMLFLANSEKTSFIPLCPNVISCTKLACLRCKYFMALILRSLFPLRKTALKWDILTVSVNWHQWLKRTSLLEFRFGGICWLKCTF